MDEAMENCTLEDLYNQSALESLSPLVPSNASNWGERTKTWYAFFYLLIIIYSVLFLAFAITCILLLSKRHLAQRFKVRTFIAIDLALITLGISRFFFLILDPWGQLGFCTHYACLVFSRLLGALAFPSLTASYTLVFLTLWISARIHLGRSWVQRLKILIPLCCVHYVAALSVETVLLVRFEGALPVLIVLIACEAIFSLWGFTVCVLFLFAGCRLLKTLEKTNRKSSIICRDSPNINRHDLIEKSKFKAKNAGSLRKFSRSTMKLKAKLALKQKRAVRKITLITYVTVFLGILYSLLSIVNLLLLIFVLFGGCPGGIWGAQVPPEAWLALRYVFLTIEICMAVLLTYSINDCTPVFNALINLLLKCCRLPVDVEDTALPSSTDLPSSPTIVLEAKPPDSPPISSIMKFKYPPENGRVSQAKTSPLVVSQQMEVSFKDDGNRKLQTPEPEEGRISMEGTPRTSPRNSPPAVTFNPSAIFYEN